MFLASSNAGMVQLPKTGQTKCYSSVWPYNEIACAGTGQDGEIQAGVAWPNPRFMVTYCDATGPCTNQSLDCDGNASTDVVIDNLTGLMWTRDGNLPNGTKEWQEALDYIANNINAASGLCGYTDWVLPNNNQLESIVNAEEPDIAVWLNGQGFSNVQSADYWSSTTYAYDTGYAWHVNMLWFGLLLMPTSRSGRVASICGMATWAA